MAAVSGVVAAALLCLTGCGGSTDLAPSAPADTPAESAPPAPSAQGSALAALDQLTVRGRAATTGYTRSQFGPAWTDVDRNGCDTRDDILRRDLTDLSTRPGTSGCVITAGRLADPYTGTTLIYVRGSRNGVDIDHVVALRNAWVSGAQSWPFAKRLAFANDPLNLLAVDPGQNRQKGDGDAATWLPRSRDSWCPYAARQIGVKAKFGLSVTPAEGAALRRVLQDRCPNQAVLTGGGAVVANGFDALAP